MSREQLTLLVRLIAYAAIIAYAILILTEDDNGGEKTFSSNHKGGNGEAQKVVHSIPPDDALRESERKEVG